MSDLELAKVISLGVGAVVLVAIVGFVTFMRWSAVESKKVDRTSESATKSNLPPE